MSARMVIRDVGRALDISYADTDKLAKMIPNELHITIKKALEQNRELKELYENDETVKNCWKLLWHWKECQGRLLLTHVA